MNAKQRRWRVRKVKQVLSGLVSVLEMAANMVASGNHEQAEKELRDSAKEIKENTK